MTRHDLGEELRLTRAELLRILGVRVTIRMATPAGKPRKPCGAKPYCRPREPETEFLLPGEARALGRQIRVWSVVSGVPMRTLAREVRTSPGHLSRVANGRLPFGVILAADLRARMEAVR
jgi:hypothetical protein